MFSLPLGSVVGRGVDELNSCIWHPELAILVGSGEHPCPTKHTQSLLLRAARVVQMRQAPVKQGQGVNLRWALRLGVRNVLTLSEDHWFPHLSVELGRLRVDIVGLCEMRKPGNGEISSEGYT